jgi:hypothetical protein
VVGELARASMVDSDSDDSFATSSRSLVFVIASLCLSLSLSDDGVQGSHY